MTVKNDITAHIDSALAAMATANDYNFDWTAWNVYDPEDRDYPQGFSTYNISESEETIMSNKYTSIINAVFTVVVDNSADVDLLFSQVLEDIQRMFDDEHTNLQNHGMIKEDHAGVIEEYLLNKLRPGRITINWDIRYRVSMSDPSST